jgi:ABC-type nickel/cobalt efflux system permease component RcnA
MMYGPELLLVGAVAGVGVLHTIVPDHWAPIALVARQRGWTKAETGRAALKAGTGHVLSTLAIALIVWIAGVAFAQRFGHWVDIASSMALIGFGGWIAISSLLEMRGSGGHGHSHGYAHAHFPLASGDAVHGPEPQTIETGHGRLSLSIFEAGVPPCFRLSGTNDDTITVKTTRDDGSQQTFAMKDWGRYWESVDTIPEPHQFSITITTGHEGHSHSYATRFTEHTHRRDGHAHGAEVQSGLPKISSSTALLLILGSSPMVEGIPAFFAAGKYGVGLIAIMSVVFAIATIVTYVALCVYSTVGLQRVSLGPLERYGEVLSGVFIALVGVVFWVWPVL